MSYKITDYSYSKAKKLGVDIKPSKNKNKKIDVFKNDKKIASIGAIGYNDYPTYISKKGVEYAEKQLVEKQEADNFITTIEICSNLEIYYTPNIKLSFCAYNIPILLLNNNQVEVTTFFEWQEEKGLLFQINNFNDPSPNPTFKRTNGTFHEQYQNLQIDLGLDLSLDVDTNRTYEIRAIISFYENNNDEKSQVIKTDISIAYKVIHIQRFSVGSQSNNEYNYFIHYNKIYRKELIQQNRLLFIEWANPNYINLHHKINGLSTLFTQLFDSLEHGLQSKSKLTDAQLTYTGLSGINFRHFYNNIGATILENKSYLEVGLLTGSTLFSLLYNNQIKNVIGIDRWKDDDIPYLGNDAVTATKSLFFNSLYTYKTKNNFDVKHLKILERNCWDVSTEEIVFEFNNNHNDTDNNDLFLYVVDDWNDDLVREGTFTSIKSVSADVIYKFEIFTESNPGFNSSLWHNG
eukprot:gene6641-9117_t